MKELAFLHEFNLYSMILRMLIAMIAGGLIGIERESKRRPAGFRTHILICLGACMTTLTGQYLTLYKGFYGDSARLGAQVVAGIGFVGAGTILVTKNSRVRGLTTAAGLWVTAIIGLAAGAGYYSGSISATVAVLLAELLLTRVEYKARTNAKDISCYLEYDHSETMNGLVAYLNTKDIHVLNMEISKNERGGKCAVIMLRLPSGITYEQMKEDVVKYNTLLELQRL